MGIINSGSCAVTSENINVGFGEVLDLCEVFKGEEEAVALLVY